MATEMHDAEFVMCVFAFRNELQITSTSTLLFLLQDLRFSMCRCKRIFGWNGNVFQSCYKSWTKMTYHANGLLAAVKTSE